MKKVSFIALGVLCVLVLMCLVSFYLRYDYVPFSYGLSTKTLFKLDVDRFGSNLILSPSGKYILGYGERNLYVLDLPHEELYDFDLPFMTDLIDIAWIENTSNNREEVKAVRSTFLDNGQVLIQQVTFVPEIMNDVAIEEYEVAHHGFDESDYAITHFSKKSVDHRFDYGHFTSTDVQVSEDDYEKFYSPNREHYFVVIGRCKGVLDCDNKLWREITFYDSSGRAKARLVDEERLWSQDRTTVLLGNTWKSENQIIVIELEDHGLYVDVITGYTLYVKELTIK